MLKASDRAAALVQAQRAWFSWRDREADFCAQQDGVGREGSLYKASLPGCKADLTAARAQSLEAEVQLLEMTTR